MFQVLRKYQLHGNDHNLDKKVLRADRLPFKSSRGISRKRKISVINEVTSIGLPLRHTRNSEVFNWLIVTLL